jgi:hypothetical protein
LVAEPAVPAFEAFAALMTIHDYLFLESAGGTYNPRQIAPEPDDDPDDWSLHSYGIAIDLNPSKNPYGTTTTDIPEAFRLDVARITTTAGRRVFEWGGGWSTPDPMHFEIDVPPAELADGITWPSPEEDEMPLSPQAENTANAWEEAFTESGIGKLSTTKNVMLKLIAMAQNYPEKPSAPTTLTEAQIKAIVNGMPVVGKVTNP